MNLIHTKGFPGGSHSKESTCNAGDLGLIPGLGRSPEGWHGNSLQYSCLENPHGQEEPGGLQSTGSQRVGHGWVTKHSTQHTRYQQLNLTFFFRPSVQMSTQWDGQFQNGFDLISLLKASQGHWGVCGPHFRNHWSKRIAEVSCHPSTIHPSFVKGLFWPGIIQKWWMTSPPTAQLRAKHKPIK